MRPTVTSEVANAETPSMAVAAFTASWNLKVKKKMKGKKEKLKKLRRKEADGDEQDGEQRNNGGKWKNRMTQGMTQTLSDMRKSLRKSTTGRKSPSIAMTKTRASEHAA